MGERPAPSGGGRGSLPAGLGLGLSSATCVLYDLGQAVHLSELVSQPVAQA